MDNHNIILYQLIQSDCLNEILPKLSNLENYSNDSLLLILDKFVTNFYNIFPTIGNHIELGLEYILKNNSNNFIQIYSSYSGNYSQRISEQITATFFYTFFKNIKYFKSIKDFLKDNNINYRQKKNKVFSKNWNSIISFFQKVSLANFNHQVKIMYLFRDLEKDLEKVPNDEAKIKLTTFYLNTYTDLLETTYPILILV